MRKRPPQTQDRKSALDLIEEATHILRSAPYATIGLYYIGALPFILALLYFWTAMIRSAFAQRYCAVASLGLALLFLWMKCWQTIFVHDLLAHVRGSSPFPWSFQRIRRLVGVQTILQPWGMIGLPIAMILGVPFPWMYSFFQNITVLGDGRPATNDHRLVLSTSWNQATHWTRQNLMLIWLLSPWLLVVAAALMLVFLPVLATLNPDLQIIWLFGIFLLLLLPLNPFGVIVAANIGATLIMLPQLAKMLFGIETLFTLSGHSSLNSTFFAVVCSLSYLCLDPLVKTVYALRCFYGESLHSGEDLKVALRRVMTTALLITMCGIIASLLSPSPLQAAPEAAPVISTEELDSRLDEVMEQAEYAWRLPRERSGTLPTEEEPSGFWHSVFNTPGDWLSTVEDWFDRIGDWLSNLEDWIQDLFPGGDSTSRQGGSAALWGPRIQGLLLLLLTFVACLLAVLLWRTWKTQPPTGDQVEMEAIELTPDLTDEEVDAAELPEEGWLHLAKTLLEQGQLRLAMRAIYLATLSALAQHDLIRLARFKSDREYTHELQRRAHAHPHILNTFTENLSLFEYAWYGMHEVSEGTLTYFRDNHDKIQRLLTHAESRLSS